MGSSLAVAAFKADHNNGPEQEKPETGTQVINESHIDPVERTSAEKALIRKIDWHLLPTVWLLYLLAVSPPKDGCNYLNTKNSLLLRSIWIEETWAMREWLE